MVTVFKAGIFAAEGETLQAFIWTPLSICADLKPFTQVTVIGTPKHGYR